MLALLVFALAVAGAFVLSESVHATWVPYVGAALILLGQFTAIHITGVSLRRQKGGR